MPSSHLILCRPLLLLPPIPTSIRVFYSESTLRMRRPKYWSFSFSISPSKEHAGLISFRMDWLDLLAVQGTLKSLIQHHSSKASILWCSAFFTVQLSHPYMTTGKTIEHYSAIKKNEIMPFITTWMDLEIGDLDLEIILSEVSPTEKDKYCILICCLYMECKKNGTNELIYKMEIELQM